MEPDDLRRCLEGLEVSKEVGDVEHIVEVKVGEQGGASKEEGEGRSDMARSTQQGKLESLSRWRRRRRRRRKARRR